jgi:serine O-acetyltransferase
MFLHKRSEKLILAIHQHQKYRDRHSPIGILMRRVAALRIEFWTIISGCDIHREATIHRTTRFPHPSGVVIHRETIVHEDCLIMQQVTLGQTAEFGAPTLARGVYVGAGAKILGRVHIGENARIGANAVVLKDVPANTTAVGIPARLINRKM